MTMPDLDCFIKLSAQQKKFCRRGYKGRGTYEKRPERSREELLNYLREKQVRSSRDLISKRQPGEPAVYDYAKAFGSWRAAMETAFGKKIDILAAEITPDYLIKCVLGFNLWTYEQYVNARRLRPEVIPSFAQVRKLFGSYSNLKYYAQRNSLRDVLQKYLDLRDQLGRWPTRQQCRRAGLDISRPIEHFGSRRKMNDFLRRAIEMLDRHNASS